MRGCCELDSQESFIVIFEEQIKLKALIEPAAFENVVCKTAVIYLMASLIWGFK